MTRLGILLHRKQQPVKSEIMSPKPQEHEQRSKVFVTGMAGLYPEANNVMEFREILYNKVNPIRKTDRWETNNPEAAQYLGHISGIDQFDAQFFRVPSYVVTYTEPMSRKLMEQAYQAVYDAGYTPEHLTSMKVGVYTGAGFSDTSNSIFSRVQSSKNGISILGLNKTMFANRISYALNLKGPSTSVDDFCCGSLVALQRAYRDIASGRCDAAIVGGSYVCLSQHATVHHGRITCRSKDDKTKCFDENADGFAMSDAIGVLFLQNEEAAKRIYAEVVFASSVFGGMDDGDFGPKYGFYRNPDHFSNYLKSFYETANVSPNEVEYVEAFGSASPEADKAELEALEKVFCENRKDALVVGSVMSNVGYTEAATGTTAVTKVLLGYHTGKLAGNLHCDTPRQDVQALRDGRMRIATDHKEFGRSYAAVNGISALGSNAHVLLKGHYKPKDYNRYKSSFPHLVTISARLNTSVKHVMDNLKARPVDPEEIALLHNIHTKRMSGHLGRGYVILDTNEAGKTVSLAENYVHFDKADHPLWFVYSGMGSQWAGMGATLMRVPVFAEAIKRCAKVLKPKGIDIVHIITTKDKKIFDNILHSFVGIAAIQIGLTDILTTVGIVPDKIIGHSVGELGCAYADGCFTAEEMILAAYSRGIVSSQTKFIRGSMAAIGLGYNQVLPLLPEQIEVACRNSSTSCTISGPHHIMRAFVGQLTAHNIFAKEVPCSEIAFHSRYIAEGGPALLKYLKQIITDPKPRTERWVSTSIPQVQWTDPLALTSSAEYHTNNLLSPVLFEEACRLIPENAVLVEIAPHGLLQAILVRSLHSSCKNIALTKRGDPDNTVTVLEGIGRLFEEGYNPNLAALYPKVEFPVSTETPMLSHLVEWAHNDLPLPMFSMGELKKAAICKFIIMIHDDEFKHFQGHLIRGKIHYPFSAALMAVWDTLSMSLNKPKKQTSVKFTDLHLLAQPVIQKQRSLKITVAIFKGSGKFEVRNENTMVMTGNIEVLDLKKTELPDKKQFVASEEDLTADDVYQLFYDRDMQYENEFRSLHKVNNSLTQAEVFKNDWVTYLDGVMQLANLNRAYDHVSQPSLIRSLIIDVTKMQGNVDMYSANVLHEGTIRCGGILIEDLRFKDLPFVRKESIVLKALDESSVKESKTNYMPRNAALQSSIIGDLDSLEWVEVPEPHGSGINVNVHYAAINTVDVKRAVGEVPFEDDHRNEYGMDFSGLTDNGCRVMGLVRCGSTARRVRACPELLWPVPAHWTLEDAATVPSAYMHAFYCFTVKTSLTPGMRVLVHGGAGALGQALVSVALALKADVFTTVSDVSKKRFLLRLFPELQEDHVGCSRDNSFSDMVLSLTNGEGVNIVVSCIPGQLKQATLKADGYILDVSQIAHQERYNLGMTLLLWDCHYTRADFKSILTNYNTDQLKSLQAMVFEGIRLGYVRPLTRVIYAPQEAPRAYRLLTASNHRGRVLIKLDVENTVSKLVCSREQSQLVVSSDEGLGALWVERLYAKGATNVTLHCQHQSKYIYHKIRSWKKLGMNVALSSSSLATRDDVARLVKEARSVAPLEGVYVIAVDDLNNDDVNFVVNNLDYMSRKLSTPVKYFGVLNEVKNIGLEARHSRAQAKRPVTVLTIPQKVRTWTSKDGVSTRLVLDAFETSFSSPSTALSVNLERIKQTTLLEEIAKIADMKIPASVSGDCSLLELGLRRESISAVSTHLCDVHNISLPENYLVNLTVKKLRDIEEYQSEVDFKEVCGLERFFSHFETDATQLIGDAVLMPTLVNSNITDLDDFDMTQSYLCIVPGLEGQHSRFRALCEGLKVSALVLQPGYDEHETVEDTAQRLAQCLFRRLDLKNTKKHFYLLGYESGICVALEVAAILEENGLSGTVFLLGGTEPSVRDTLSEWSNSLNPNAWDTISKDLCIDLSNQQHEELQVGAAAMLQRAISPRALPQLRARLVVLAASEARDDPSLHFHRLPTPLAHLPQDLRCAAIINSYITPEDIEAFQQKNLCDAYLTSTQSLYKITK